MLHAGRLHPPVVAVEHLESGEERLRPLRVEAEVVDRVVGAAPGQLTLLIEELDDLHELADVDDLAACQLAQSRGQRAETLHRVHRRVAPQSPDRPGQAEPLAGSDDLGLLALGASLARGRLDQLLNRRARRRRCFRETRSSYSCRGEGASMGSTFLPAASASMAWREL